MFLRMLPEIGDLNQAANVCVAVLGIRSPIVRLNRQPSAELPDDCPLRVCDGYKFESVTEPLLVANNGLRVQDGYVVRNGELQCYHGASGEWLRQDCPQPTLSDDDAAT